MNLKQSSLSSENSIASWWWWLPIEPYIFFCYIVMTPRHKIKTFFSRCLIFNMSRISMNYLRWGRILRRCCEMLLRWWDRSDIPFWTRDKSVSFRERWTWLGAKMGRKLVCWFFTSTSKTNLLTKLIDAFKSESPSSDCHKGKSDDDVVFAATPAARWRLHLNRVCRETLRCKIFDIYICQHCFFLVY